MKLKSISIFSEFVFGENRSISVSNRQPATVKEWVMHMISEYLGTILLTMAFAGPAIQLANGHQVVDYMGNKLFLAFYGFVAIGVILILFLRWSCDLNPTVPITRMLNGKNTIAYGMSKIVVQFVAALTTAGIFIALSAGPNGYGKFAFNAHDVKFAPWPELNTWTATFFWDLFVECLMIIILLWAIFSKSFSDKYRDLMICFVIGIAILAGLYGGSIALNPARGLAQQLPAIFMGQTNFGINATTVAIMVSMIAPFIFLTLQGITSEWFIPALLKGIAWKNPNMNFMQDEQPRETFGKQIKNKQGKEKGSK